MITGVVRSLEARIRLTIRGSRRREHEIDAVIDTGFTGSLTLPSWLIARLGLRWQSVDRGQLAEGSECLLDVYEGLVIWDRLERAVTVNEAETEPLVGMALLEGYELRMEVRSRGKVRIKRLP